MLRGRICGLSVLLLVSVACGGNDTNDAPDGGGNGKVTAAFTSVANADIDTPVAFDASASSGSGALAYDWSFGNGNRGSGSAIAQIYRDSGTFQVTLTVSDGDGNRDSVTRSLVINPPASTATVSAAGIVTTLDDQPLAGVTVTERRTGVSAVTDLLGRVTLEVALGRGVVLDLAKDGFAGQLVSLRFPEGTGGDASFSACMRTRGAVQDFDAKAGGTLSGEHGARVTFPSDALVDAGGTRRDGTAQLAMTPVDITLPAAGGFPGEFTGVNGDGSTTPIVSFGTTEYAIAAAGDRLNLAPGKRAAIELPVYADAHIDGTVLTAGERIPLWSLDEQSGVWVNEGDGELIASPDAPGGFIMRAEVGHFSWWNVDIGFDPTDIDPKCVPDVVPGAESFIADATICNMLTDIDRGLGGDGDGINNLVAQTTPRLPGYAATANIPVNGGQRFPVPANTNLKVVGSALNGTWRGTTTIRSGASGGLTNVTVVMRPVEVAIDGEIITLPFDENRALNDTTPVRYVFSSPGNKYVRVTMSSGDASSLTGTVSIRDSSGVLVTQNFNTFNTTFDRAVVAPGPYVIEVTGVSGVPGTFHLRAELVGTVDTEALSLPISVTHTIPAVGIYRAQFTTSGAVGLSGLLGGGGQNLKYRIANALGATVGQGTAGVFGGYIPSAGTYSIDVYTDTGFAVGINLAVQTTVWPAAVADLDLGALGGYGSDIQLMNNAVDHNGALVIGYVAGEGGGDARFEIKRLAGSSLANVATLDDLTYTPNCTAFGFDADNNPVVIDETPASQMPPYAPELRVRRYVSGSWQNVGTGGLLPHVGPASASGCHQPFITVWNGQLLVAYNVDTSVWVNTFNGTAWVGVGPNDGLIAGAYGASQGGPRSYALAVSPDNKPTIAYSAYQANTRVAQLNAAGTAWEDVGGELTTTGMGGPLTPPRLAFDASSRPRVAGGAGYNSTTEMFVFVFSGTTWSSSGPLHTSTTEGYTQSGEIDHAFFDGASFTVNTETFNGSNSTITKRNDGTAWSSVGADRGQVDRLSENFYRHFAVSGGSLYLVGQPQGSPAKITIRRYTP